MPEEMGVNERKAKVAEALLIAAGDLLERWTEAHQSRGEEPPCEVGEAREYISTWLKRLPGNYWDDRLGEVE
ncbi:hypothetical protein [Streptomyces johnsoniae]|uniref:Uncharacterized protein n=1 Tax=Streptomyces johnsoniae TaxID=3075532 RepID=A0ABU2S064_9ACTN|nr:hypothetical protein [Streptomyces sp. DSM 41886]MDT0442297.1 hypothetical protein [Streptomyces sp. DSM 41886]